MITVEFPVNVYDADKIQDVLRLAGVNHINPVTGNKYLRRSTYGTFLEITEDDLENFFEILRVITLWCRVENKEKEEICTEIN